MNTAWLRTGIRFLAGLLIASALFWWVDSRLGWSRLLQPWKTFPLSLLFSILLLTGLAYGLRARRFHLLMQEKTGGRYSDFLRINIWHTTAINWLPMRLGETLFPWLMRHYFNHPVLHSSGSLLWIRLLDLFSLLWLGALTWAVFHAQAWLLPVMAALLLIPLGWWLHGLLHQRLRQHDRGLGHGLYQLLSGFPDSLALYLKLSLLTLAAWGMKLAAFLLAALQLSDLTVVALLPGVVAAELASALPIQGLAGFGTYEAAMVLGSGGSQSLAQGEIQDSLLATAVNLHLFILASSLLFSLLAWLLPSPGNQKNPTQG